MDRFQQDACDPTVLWNTASDYWIFIFTLGQKTHCKVNY